ncbi:hypothetical protein [Frankia gtarii]|uniref:hypothetical protein n=1 Tax=Frankia gtarii TaxID=2950102 RepID=UPI0021C0FA67|nr:hypothetical protein [Frankia gtarii]
MTGTSGSPGASLVERASADGTTFVLATFVDLDGKPCAKPAPAPAAAALDGAPWPFAPRIILRRLCQRLADLLALAVEAAAMAGVPLAGTDWIPTR